MLRSARILSKVISIPVLGACMIPFGACSSSPEEHVGTSAPDQPAAASESLTVPIDGQTAATATHVHDGGVRVEIASRQGRLDFVATFRLTSANQTTMDYTFFPPDIDEDMPSASESNTFTFDSSALPTLENAINGAVFVRSQFSAAVLQNYDDWGCDLLPGRYNGLISCGSRGACCDRHDTCYADNHCTGWSWLFVPWHPCQVRCNLPAAGCFLALEGPGPSECCALENCGQPRCTPTTCAAAGATCGSISDGCEGTLDCGGCPGGMACGAANQCGCPERSEVCGEECLPACEGGKVRAPGSCSCECPIGTEVCGEQCLAPCGDGFVREPASCECSCPAAARECGGRCVPSGCSEGQSFNESSCTCECPTLVPPHYDTREEATDACWRDAYAVDPSGFWQYCTDYSSMHSGVIRRWAYHGFISGSDPVADYLFPLTPCIESLP